MAGVNVAKLPADDPRLLQHYEGLVRKTAGMIAPRVEEEFEDICQILRVKVHYALQRYDPVRCRTSRDSFVFSCVVNQKKDILAKRRRNELHIEDIAPTESNTDGSDRAARDRFEGRYLSIEDEQVYRDIEDDVLIPSTLTAVERAVVLRLYYGDNQIQAADELGLTRGEVAKAVKRIREKMADWAPDGTESPVPQVEAA